MTEAPTGLVRLSARYRALVEAGEIADDPAQQALLARFDALNQSLAERRLARKGRALGWLFGGRTPPPKGLYIHGAVGRGKTMLMDAFFAVAVPERKRRLHFNEFMADVHDRLHAFRQTPAGGAGDPIPAVATALAGETSLLCLDELMVEDIADAMILSRLFEALFGAGLVLVATSNSPPGELYRDGLNRALFLPFVALLERRVDVVELTSPTDYRLAKLAGAPVYITPLGAEAKAALDRRWLGLTGAVRGAPASLPLKGRAIAVPQAAKGAARFSFADLCDAPLGAGDYLAIARAYQTVMIDDIPVIADGERDRARRLINLVDTLYDNGIRLIASAAAEPAALYTAATGEEAFAFRRTVSRLTEMRSAEWVANPTRKAGEGQSARSTPRAGSANGAA